MAYGRFNSENELLIELYRIETGHPNRLLERADYLLIELYRIETDRCNVGTPISV